MVEERPKRKQRIPLSSEELYYLKKLKVLNQIEKINAFKTSYFFKIFNFINICLCSVLAYYLFSVMFFCVWKQEREIRRAPPPPVLCYLPFPPPLWGKKRKTKQNSPDPTSTPPLATSPSPRPERGQQSTSPSSSSPPWTTASPRTRSRSRSSAGPTGPTSCPKGRPRPCRR